MLRNEAPDLRVVLVERALFPRHHVGESMLPESSHILAKMGVAEQVDAAGFLRKGGATFNWRADAVAFCETFTDRPGYREDREGRRVPIHAWQVVHSRYDKRSCSTTPSRVGSSCGPRPGSPGWSATARA